MSLEEIFRLLERKKEEKRPAPPTWIVCGLGNPGAKYETSRHNVGFETLRFFEERFGFRTTRLEFKALTARVILKLPDGKEESVLFMRPQTFMNNSGEAVGEAARFYKIPPEHVLIIYDDVSLEEGHLRIRAKGSDGGHNGIKSIIWHLGTDVFPRIKLGVGSPPTKEYDMVGWVLGQPDEEARKKIAAAAAKAPDAALEIMACGVPAAASRFNGPAIRPAGSGKKPAGDKERSEDGAVQEEAQETEKRNSGESREESLS
jgi:PTH1 family peptidyl-tRNA hydrolase